MQNLFKFKALITKSLLTKISLLLILGTVLFCIYIFFIPVNKKEESKIIDVPPGKTFYQLSEELEQKKLISSAFYFKILVWLFNKPPLFTGEYILSPKDSLWSQFQKIKEGHIKKHKITFPEGLNHYEMSLLLKSQGWIDTKEFLRLVWNKEFIQSLLKEPLPSLEGYLFPETYFISKYKPASELLREMTGEFLKTYNEIRDQYQNTPFSRNEIVTLASLIEKETGKKEERPIISSVFHNRLNIKMKLQSDPTILYGLFLKEGFDRKLAIGKKDILSPSPYNTYVIKGLPPGPIANPGKKSLQVVFAPRKTDYLYFVSRNDGTHVFSKTLKEHEKAVYKYQIAPFKK